MEITDFALIQLSFPNLAKVMENIDLALTKKGITESYGKYRHSFDLGVFDGLALIDFCWVNPAE